MTEYLVAGSHPDTLDSGRPVCPGDTVPADCVNPDSDHDRHLIETGVLIEINADTGSEPKRARGRKAQSAGSGSQEETD